MYIYCGVIKGKSISPRTIMNTDTVEWYFGDARQMVGGSTNKLTATGFNRADEKASTFNAAKFSLVGNNSAGDCERIPTLILEMMSPSLYAYHFQREIGKISTFSKTHKVKILA